MPYVVNGYAPHRLRSVIHVAQARFRRDRALRDDLTELRDRFAERKLVDRAKGILMRVRDVPEDEAFRALRSAAMQQKQRIGQVAQTIIGTPPAMRTRSTGRASYACCRSAS